MSRERGNARYVRLFRRREVAGAEGERRGRCEYRAARLGVGGARLSQRGLGIRDIHEGGESVAIRVDRRIVGFLRGAQKRNGCLALAQSNLQVLIGFDYLTHGLVARELELVFGDATLRFGETKPALAQAAVVERKFDRDRRAVGRLVDARRSRGSLG